MDDEQPMDDNVHSNEPLSPDNDNDLDQDQDLDQVEDSRQEPADELDHSQQRVRTPDAAPGADMHDMGGEEVSPQIQIYLVLAYDLRIACSTIAIAIANAINAGG
jgi:hypothetical protein